jgi:hypothetical protein
VTRKYPFVFQKTKIKVKAKKSTISDGLRLVQSALLAGGI